MNKIIRFIMVVLYIPVFIVVLAVVCRRLIKYKKAGFKIITPNNLSSLDKAMENGDAEITDLGDGYQLAKFRKYSLLAIGSAVIDPSRRIIMGCELADASQAMAVWIINHEKGHYEAPEGLSTKLFWWNPEDWLRIGQYQVFTPAELAADRWAITHGADPKVAIQHLMSSIGVSPITCIIRIYHIRRYMKKSE